MQRTSRLQQVALPKAFARLERTKSATMPIVIGHIDATEGFYSTAALWRHQSEELRRRFCRVNPKRVRQIQARLPTF